MDFLYFFRNKLTKNCRKRYSDPRRNTIVGLCNLQNAQSPKQSWLNSKILRRIQSKAEQSSR